jgi:hypothetical protein
MGVNMEKHLLTIIKSELADARDNDNMEFLINTFKQAEEVIEAGGIVNIQQLYSDGSKEIIRIINSMDKLDLFRSRYLD